MFTVKNFIESIIDAINFRERTIEKITFTIFTTIIWLLGACFFVIVVQILFNAIFYLAGYPQINFYISAIITLVIKEMIEISKHVHMTQKYRRQH